VKTCCLTLAPTLPKSTKNMKIIQWSLASARNHRLISEEFNNLFAKDLQARIWYQQYTWQFDIGSTRDNLISAVHVTIWYRQYTWQFDIGSKRDNLISTVHVTIWYQQYTWQFDIGRTRDNLISAIHVTIYQQYTWQFDIGSTRKNWISAVQWQFDIGSTRDSLLNSVQFARIRSGNVEKCLWFLHNIAK
jgi:hypothetical protein